MKQTRRARKKTDSELKKLKREIRTYYKSRRKDVSDKVAKYLQDASGEAGKLYDAIKEAKDQTEEREAKRKYKEHYSRAVKSASFATLSAQIADILLDANENTTKRINAYLPEIYALNYNAVSKDLGRDLKRYKPKPITADDADDDGDITQKAVKRQKDLLYNKKQIARLVVAGALSYKPPEKVYDHAVTRIVDSNAAAMQRTASDMTTDAESKGRLDGMYRAEDEIQEEDDGFEMKKKWVATLDNVTRPSHQEYDSMDSIPLDDEWAPGLSRPRDPNAELSEIINCRCEMIYDVGQEEATTRAARHGDVTGRVDRDSSFEGTKTITVKNMTYKEWMEWRRSK